MCISAPDQVEFNSYSCGFVIAWIEIFFSNFRRIFDEFKNKRNLDHGTRKFFICSKKVCAKIFKHIFPLAPKAMEPRLVFFKRVFFKPLYDRFHTIYFNQLEIINLHLLVCACVWHPFHILIISACICNYTMNSLFINVENKIKKINHFHLHFHSF
jgi:hypothetical protein